MNTMTGSGINASQMGPDMTTNMVAAWLFDTATGRDVDSHGDNDWVTILGDPPLTTGVFDQALDMSGNTADFTQDRDGGLAIPTGAWTVAGLAKFDPSDTSNNAINIYAFDEDFEDSDYEVYFGMNAGGLLELLVAKTSNTTWETVTATAAYAGGWAAFIASYTGAGTKTLKAQINDGTIQTQALAATPGARVNGIVNMYVFAAEPASPRALDVLVISAEDWSADQRSWFYNGGSFRNYPF